MNEQALFRVYPEYREMKGHSLCEKCVQNINCTDTGYGMIIEICNKCELQSVSDYFDNKRKQTMTEIDSKRTLHREIKSIVESNPEVGRIFPQTFTYCEGRGKPIFTFTVERKEEDHFIDESGQKWVKA